LILEIYAWGRSLIIDSYRLTVSVFFMFALMDADLLPVADTGIGIFDRVNLAQLRIALIPVFYPILVIIHVFNPFNLISI
jgi:hypothetical protein